MNVKNNVPEEPTGEEHSDYRESFNLPRSLKTRPYNVLVTRNLRAVGEEAVPE